MLFSRNIIESKPSNEGCNVFQACGRGVTPVEAHTAFLNVPWDCANPRLLERGCCCAHFYGTLIRKIIRKGPDSKKVSKNITIYKQSGLSKPTFISIMFQMARPIRSTLTCRTFWCQFQGTSLKGSPETRAIMIFQHAGGEGVSKNILRGEQTWIKLL